MTPVVQIAILITVDEMNYLLNGDWIVTVRAGKTKFYKLIRRMIPMEQIDL